MIEMTRKTPRRHKVESHVRKGEHGKKIYVRSHYRGDDLRSGSEAREYHKAHSYLMPRDREKTEVIFRKYPDGEIIALFPDITGSPGFIESYLHVGQHGSANYNIVMRQTKPAKPAEYAELKEELEGLGYYLDVKQKRTKFGAEMRY